MRTSLPFIFIPSREERLSESPLRVSSEHRGLLGRSSLFLFLDSPMALCYKPSLWKRFSV